MSLREKFVTALSGNLLEKILIPVESNVVDQVGVSAGDTVYESSTV
jgi:hypothetical protein